MKIKKSLLYIILFLFTAAILLPFIWMVLSALKTQDQIFSYPVKLLPEKPTFENFISIFKDYNFLPALLNSSYIAVVFTFGSVFFCALGGYAFEKFDFKFKKILFIILLGSMMIPFEVTMVPLYALFNKFNWINKHIGLIIPGLANAFGIFFMRQYMAGINSEIIESGRIDGASEIGIFVRLILPIARPAIASLGIMFFMNSWNNFLWPLIVLKSEDKYTLAVAIRAFNQGMRTPYNLIMAGSVVSIIPLLIIFLRFQKEFIAGIVSGSVKG